jgi:hypothetical protein
VGSLRRCEHADTHVVCLHVIRTVQHTATTSVHVQLPKALIQCGVQNVATSFMGKTPVFARALQGSYACTCSKTICWPCHISFVVWCMLLTAGLQTCFLQKQPTACLASSVQVLW